ncbi:MAG: hypothetical protein ACP5M4_03865 [Acidobacteriaceae bacterium]
MMWHTHDYGLNPEHPPLVKLLAAVPTLDKHLWTPPSSTVSSGTSPAWKDATGSPATTEPPSTSSFKCA